jgi:hypothetical protein
MEVPASSEARTETLKDLDDERAEVRGHLLTRSGLSEIDLAGCVEQRKGSAAAVAAMQRLVEQRGLTALERSFARTYVSNPRSREVVKGHAIVIAEMGLCPYCGKIVRDADLLAGEGGACGAGATGRGDVLPASRDVALRRRAPDQRRRARTPASTGPAALHDLSRAAGDERSLPRGSGCPHRGPAEPGVPGEPFAGFPDEVALSYRCHGALNRGSWDVLE